MEYIFVVMSESKMADICTGAYPNCFCLTIDEANEAKEKLKALRGKYYEYWVEELPRWNGEVI